MNGPGKKNDTMNELGFAKICCILDYQRQDKVKPMTLQKSIINIINQNN